MLKVSVDMGVYTNTQGFKMDMEMHVTLCYERSP